ncbi:hypothetical protein E2C01_055101 [Portunus trituberculatus]|uniref:Uncharacterized protein n=1 Tax=Portunus trituberculatus TaxID=210409 RepID=A0A5B7GVP5_PORTR|nr:hypothetical protein [Portunus trituberculatus]
MGEPLYFRLRPKEGARVPRRCSAAGHDPLAVACRQQPAAPCFLLATRLVIQLGRTANVTPGWEVTLHGSQDPCITLSQEGPVHPSLSGHVGGSSAASGSYR